MNPKIEELREKAHRLPMLPGVYIMLNSKEEVIYIGKAKKLRNRVSSYFRDVVDREKTAALVSNINDFNVIIADTEFEALVLENSLIKRHMPKYNILLKDDKSYPFIRLDLALEYPTFSLVNKPSKDGAQYFGPYTGRNAVNEAIDAICKALKLPTCSRKFPRDIGKSRPCLNYHMGNCLAYCLPDTEQSEYRRSIEQAVMILRGHSDELVSRLRSEMETAAEELRFEQAASLRDRLRAVESLGKHQKIVSGAHSDTDVIGYYHDVTRSCFVVLHYISGTLLDKDCIFTDSPVSETAEAASEFIVQYYSQRPEHPQRILLPEETEDIEEISKYLSSLSEQAVELIVPQRGEKRRLVEMALTNAEEELKRSTTREERVTKSQEWLQAALGLENIPHRIEAFDVSNTGDSDIVSAMTVFVNGKPLKKAYRKFKIKWQNGQDDYAAMRETVQRRYTHLKNGDEGFDVPPDIILIDGGEQHTRIASDVLAQLGLNLPVFGMVKDDRHRTRALVSTDGAEIGIYSYPAVFSLIGRIQEETHRCAIEYNRKLHEKNSIGSSLENIAGVGEKRRQALLKHFRSVHAISEAGLDELCRVIPANAAKAVYLYYHESEDVENK